MTHPAIVSAIERAPADGYLRYHAQRYDALLKELLSRWKPGFRVLDIGRSTFTDIAAESLGCPVDTLGFESDREAATGRNFHFDLNQSQLEASWRRDIPEYDLIVFSEVIEHLHTSPARVLPFIRSLLRPDGLVFIQTPNAVVLHKRLQLLLGSNPYNLISENTGNPGHFREYTSAELRGYCAPAGLSVESLRTLNYFDYRYADHLDGRCVKQSRNGLINLLYRVLPASFRPGLFLVAKRVD
jgi:SAM-dependent methyltransferase